MDLSYTWVLHNLSQYATITSANDEHFFRVWVSEHWDVHDGLLVCELISLSYLNYSVYYYYLSVSVS